MLMADSSAGVKDRCVCVCVCVCVCFYVSCKYIIYFPSTLPLFFPLFP